MEMSGFNGDGWDSDMGGFYGDGVVFMEMGGMWEMGGL